MVDKKSKGSGARKSARRDLGLDDVLASAYPAAWASEALDQPTLLLPLPQYHAFIAREETLFVKWVDDQVAQARANGFELFVLPIREAPLRALPRPQLGVAEIVRYINRRGAAEGFSGVAIVSKQQGTRSERHDALKRARQVIAAELVDDHGVSLRQLAPILQRSSAAIHHLVAAGRKERKRPQPERERRQRKLDARYTTDVPPSDAGIPADVPRLPWETQQNQKEE